MRLKQKFKNAESIIKQINDGEWEFTGHYPDSFDGKFICYTAKRNGIELWLGNGAFSCQIRDKPWELGMFGVWVWFSGAGKRARALERSKRRQPSDLTR